MELKKRRNSYLVFLLLCLVAAAAIAGMSALLYESETSQKGVAEESGDAENENDGEIADSGNESGNNELAKKDGNTGDTALKDGVNGADDGTQIADSGNAEQTDGSDTAGNSENTAEGNDSQDPEGAGGGNASSMAEASGSTGENAGDSLAAAGQVSEMLAEKIAAYSFEAGKITWPVEGEICLEYNMEHTIYYSTLDLYRCNPGVCIGAEAGTEVLAGVEGVVTGIAEDNFYGTTVTVALGDDYEVTYGQLTDVSVSIGDEVTASTRIGAVAEPSIYFTEEGAHLFLEMTKNGETVDPLDYLNY